MARTYFGTDGIRGLVGRSPITPDFALRLAHAVGRVLRRKEARPMVLIGKDTRISGYMLESALESGFNSAGVDVMLLGPLPTPGVAYLTRAQRASLGVVISASHNPYYDNGIKFFSAQGTKLPDAWEEEVEQALTEDPVWADSAALGKARRLEDAAGRYIEFCKSTFDHALTLKGVKIVVDAALGAAYQIAPKVFHELGADVVAIGCAPDGLNINEDVGATHPEALVLAVRANKADFGVALDGDADRLLLVDAAGRLYNGDELLYLLAADRLARGEAVPGAVGTLMTNMAVEVALKSQGVGFVRAKVGDRYVLEELHRQGWTLGGRGLGPSAGAGQAHHWRWPGQRAAGAAGLRAFGQEPVAVAVFSPAVSPGIAQRAAAAGPGLEAQHPAGGSHRGRQGRTGRYGARAYPRQRHRAFAARDGGGARWRSGQPLCRAPGQRGQEFAGCLSGCALLCMEGRGFMPRLFSSGFRCAR